MRARIRVKHYSLRIEQAYVDWIRRFSIFHDKQHPMKMGKAKMKVDLYLLVPDRQFSASTQNHAETALLFLCREALGQA